MAPLMAPLMTTDCLPHQAEIQPEQRLWCTAECPGCARFLSILVVPGLDVIQCSYCSHLSFTHPLDVDAAAELAHNDSRNVSSAVPSSARAPLALPAPAHDGAGAGRLGAVLGAPPPPPLLLNEAESEGRGMVFSWQEGTTSHLCASAPPPLQLAAGGGVGLVLGWQAEGAVLEPSSFVAELAAAAARGGGSMDVDEDVDMAEVAAPPPGQVAASVPPSRWPR